jgi:hypothetical protein
MEIDPYDTRVPWLPRQEQSTEYRRQEQIPEYGRDEPSYEYGRQEQSAEYRSDEPAYWDEPQPLEKYQKIQPPPHMPKAQAQALVRSLKNSLLIASVVGFGAFSWLIAGQLATSSAQNSFDPSHSQPAGPSDDQGGFFHHQGGDYFGRHHHDDNGQNWSQDQQGQNQGQDSGPVSGTHVS